MSLLSYWVRLPKPAPTNAWRTKKHIRVIADGIADPLYSICLCDADITEYFDVCMPEGWCTDDINCERCLDAWSEFM